MSSSALGVAFLGVVEGDRGALGADELQPAMSWARIRQTLWRTRSHSGHVARASCVGHDAQPSLQGSVVNMCSIVEVARAPRIIIEAFHTARALTHDRVAKFVPSRRRYRVAGHAKGVVCRF